MASRPSRSRPAAHCASAAPPSAHSTPTLLCDECGERESKIFCKNCGSTYCAECDAGIHVRARKDHVRVDAGARLFHCSIHKEEARVYCVYEKRLACATCVLPGETCDGHPGAIKKIEIAAMDVRGAVAALSCEVSAKEALILREIENLKEARDAIVLRIQQLEQVLESSNAARQSLSHTQSLSDMQFLHEARLAMENAQTAHAQLLHQANAGEWATALARIQRVFAKREREGEADTAPKQSGEKAKKAAEMPAAGRQPPAPAPAPAPMRVPFSRPRSIGLPALTYPTNIGLSPVDDNTCTVADHTQNAPAWQVWRDGSRPAQQLPPATANATTVIPLGTCGFLILSHEENRIERTGNTPWIRKDRLGPWAAALVDETAFITECPYDGPSKVVQLDLVTGATLHAFGRGMLRSPVGIAVTPTKEILVADGDSLIQVFDTGGTPLRTLGEGLFKSAWGVCVDTHNRVYVADSIGRAILVLDASNGNLLSTIRVQGNPRGVTVTPRQELLVTTVDPVHLLLIAPE